MHRLSNLATVGNRNVSDAVNMILLLAEKSYSIHQL